MKHSAARIFSVMRVVDSEICFLDLDDAFDQLTDRTVLYDSRDEAYSDARQTRGLVVSIGYKTADAAGLVNAIWDAQRLADREPRVASLEEAA